jgi:N-ethylmaleimide reductase
MVEYYSARASAGLILTESAAVSAEGNCYPMAGNMFTDEQAAGWKKVTDAVHAKGGRIFVQLYHAGRVAHPDFTGGLTPIGASAIVAKGEVHTQNGR